MKNKHHAVDRFLGANLVFGAYDLSRTPSQRASAIEAGTDILDGTGFPLDLFLPGCSAEQRRDPDVSPLLRRTCAGCPRALSVGTNDHLLDDTLFMAARWKSPAIAPSCSSTPKRHMDASPFQSVAAHFFPRLFTFFRDC